MSICSMGMHLSSICIIKDLFFWELHNAVSYTLKTSGSNLTQIGSNRDPDPGQYATDANRVKLTRKPGPTYLTRNFGSIFNPE